MCMLSVFVAIDKQTHTVCVSLTDDDDDDDDVLMICVGCWCVVDSLAARTVTSR